MYRKFSSEVKKTPGRHVEGIKTRTPVGPVFYCASKQKNKAFEFGKYLKTGVGITFRNKRFLSSLAGVPVPGLGEGESEASEDKPSFSTASLRNVGEERKASEDKPSFAKASEGEWKD
jgi:hypothetical protein